MQDVLGGVILWLIDLPLFKEKIREELEVGESTVKRRETKLAERKGSRGRGGHRVQREGRFLGVIYI